MRRNAKPKLSIWKPECEYTKGTVVWHSGGTWKARRKAPPFVEPRWTGDKDFPWERVEARVDIKATLQPCPKCNSTSRRPEGRVCDKCVREIINDHVTMKKLRAAVDADRVQVDLDKMPYFADQYEDYRTNSLDQAIVEMARSVSTPIDKLDWEKLEPMIMGQQSARGNRDAVELPRPFLDKFRLFFEQLLKYGERRYQTGHRKGSNLLLGLATGATSISEFNEHTIYPEGREHGSSRNTE